MEKLNVAIADDNEKIVEQLSRILSQDEDIIIVGRANDGVEAYEVIKEKAGYCIIRYYYAKIRWSYFDGKD